MRQGSGTSSSAWSVAVQNFVSLTSQTTTLTEKGARKGAKHVDTSFERGVVWRPPEFCDFLRVLPPPRDLEASVLQRHALRSALASWRDDDGW